MEEEDEKDTGEESRKCGVGGAVAVAGTGREREQTACGEREERAQSETPVRRDGHGDGDETKRRPSTFYSRRFALKDEPVSV